MAMTVALAVITVAATVVWADLMVARKGTPLDLDEWTVAAILGVSCGIVFGVVSAGMHMLRAAMQ